MDVGSSQLASLSLTHTHTHTHVHMHAHWHKYFTCQSPSGPNWCGSVAVGSNPGLFGSVQTLTCVSYLLTLHSHTFMRLTRFIHACSCRNSFFTRKIYVKFTQSCRRNLIYVASRSIGTRRGSSEQDEVSQPFFFPRIIIIEPY